MAVLYLSEYVMVGAIGLGGNAAPVAYEPSNAEQTVAIAVGSTQSSAFKANTNFIRVHVDAICSIAIGANPTATATVKRLAANQTEYFAVPNGYKIAVIQNT